MDADSLTVFDDGSPLTLNLAGRDGSSGATGKDGLASDCPPVNVQQTRENVRMADGGDGGNGGNGGDGGNGGSLTVYTRDLTNLNHISVNAAGGQGGQPGQGGAGSAGCDCSQPFWTTETCSGGRPGDSNYRCITETFTCYDGQDGINGRNGIVGRAGNLGKLTVLNLDRPLEPDRPSISVPFSTLKDSGYTLSKNLWETRTGAIQLLAPGSVIDDEYQLLTQRIEKSFFLLWNAPQPFERFAGTNANLTLNETEGIQVDLPDDLWLEGTTQQRENVTEFVVYNALWERDATRLGRIALSGNGRNLKLFVTDEAGQSNLMATKFRLRYRVTQEDPLSPAFHLFNEI